MQSNVPSFRYVDVLRLAHVPSTFAAAVVGRAAYALVILPLLFAVQEATGSVATAGLAVGIYAAAAALLAPVRAHLIDAFGRRRVLLALSCAFGGLLAALAMASFTATSAPVMVVLAAGAGALAPPLGPTMRVVWSELAREPALFKKALSLDAVVEELLHLAGPALAGLALTTITPGIALLAPAILVVVGTVAFVSSSGLKATNLEATAFSTPVGPRQAHQRTLLRERRFIAILLPALVAGLISGHYTVAIPSAFPDTGGAAIAGIALGLFAGGSALGGLIFGALRIQASPRAQLVTLTTSLIALFAVSALATTAVLICVAVTIAGLFLSPLVIVTYVTANDVGGEDRKTQATTWVNTSQNTGAAAGIAAAGFLIQHTAVSASYLLMATACLLLTILATTVLRAPFT